MTKEYRTTADVVKEKYEERGWERKIGENTKPTHVEPIKPLPISEEKYRLFSILLADLALEDENLLLCDIYFELRRRAYYGNGYQPIEELAKTEQKLWSLGTDEVIEEEKHTL